MKETEVFGMAEGYKPSLGVDLDGVLSRSQELMLTLHNYKHGTDYSIKDLTEWDTWDVLGIPESEFWSCYEYMMDSGLMENAPIMHQKLPYYLEHLQEHYDIEICTARTTMGGILGKQWLRNYNFPENIKLRRVEPEDVGTKFDLGYDILVEDCPKYYNYVKHNPNKYVIIHAAPWNHPPDDFANSNKNLIRLRDWESIHDMLLIEHENFIDRFQ